MNKIVAILFLFNNLSFAQTDSTKIFNKIIIAEGLVYGASFYALNDLWYSEFEQSKFHWYNDNSTWNQIDKVGHATSAYHLSLFNHNLLESFGFSDKKSIYFSFASSLFYMSSIEFFDGKSTNWGASHGDLIANFSGSSLFLGQQLLWDEQKILMKFNFYPSEYADRNSSLLGSTYSQQIIKDYNAQTYWLSFNINSFIDSDYIPDYLNVAFGYGVSGFTNVQPSATSLREYYFSLDIDLSKIKTYNKFLKKTFQLINFVKIPFPAIRFVENQSVKFYPMFYGQ